MKEKKYSLLVHEIKVDENGFDNYCRMYKEDNLLLLVKKAIKNFLFGEIDKACIMSFDGEEIINVNKDASDKLLDLFQDISGTRNFIVKGILKK